MMESQSVDLNSIVLYLVIGGVIMSIIFVGLPYILALIKKLKAKPLPPEYQQPLDDLGQSMLKLQKFEKDREELTKNIADAQEKIRVAARLIDSFTQKAEAFIDELKTYETALKAVQSGDRTEIARTAGLMALIDEDLSLMLCSRSRDEEYWSQLIETLSADLGVKQGFIGIYRGYARSMMAQVSQFKLSVGANQKLLALAETGKPLAEVNQHLMLAAGKLSTLRVWQINFEQKLIDSPSRVPPLTQ